MKITTKTRTSGIELLRIVSMLMITLHHLAMTYGIDSTNLYIRLWAQFFFVGGKVGVNCFVLIAGYFLYSSKFRFERILKLHQQIILYGVGCIIIGIIVIPETIGLQAILKAFLPVIFNHYWFITTYIGLICFSPFINFLIDKLSYKQHSILILVCLLLFSVIPTFTAQVPYNDNLSWFCFLYILAAYFKKYNTKIKTLIGNPVITIMMWGGIWLSSVIMTLLETKFPFWGEGINFFSGMYILPELINSLSLFLCFEKLDFQSKFVNFLGKHTLACYLIQSNYVLLVFRIKLLHFVFESTNYLLYPFYALFITAIFFLCSVLIDCTREYIQNRKIVYKISESCLSVYKYIDSLANKLVEANNHE